MRPPACCTIRLLGTPPRFGTAPMLNCFTLATNLLLLSLLALLLTATRSAAHESTNPQFACLSYPVLSAKGQQMQSSLPWRAVNMLDKETCGSALSDDAHLCTRDFASSARPSSARRSARIKDCMRTCTQKFRISIWIIMTPHFLFLRNHRGIHYTLLI